MEALPPIATGASCRWGGRTLSGVFYLLGDITTSPLTTYDNNIQGTITTKPVNVAGTQRAVLRYYAAWDVECDNDYVDVQVYDGATWHTLTAPDFNINETMTAYCTSSHTHTGRDVPGVRHARHFA